MATQGSTKASLSEKRDDSPAAHSSPSSDTELPASKGTDDKVVEKTKYSWRFWAIFLSLSVTSLLAAVESTVTSTALPIISADLNAGELYIWFVNAYFLTSTAFLPLFGQIADVFGRRWLTISIVAIFVLGSGISGGAQNTGMLIAGRAVQGIGGGGINLMIDLIVCDLVPLRERGNFMAIIFAIFAVGTSLGPFIGGAIVQHASWRWVFWINLPIGGVALALLFAFLHVKNNSTQTLAKKIGRIDFIGNGILITAVTSILIALTYGGTRFSWSSWRVVLPLVLGFLGIIGFAFFESSNFVVEPTMPPHLFKNRTAATAYFLTFIHALFSFWVIYFLPVYFQGVLQTSPSRSGVLLLPTVVTIVPGGLVAGVILSKFGRYKPLHIIGFALMTLGIGLFIKLDAKSHLAVYVVLQIIAGIGSGLVLTTLLAAIQAALTDKDTALSTGAWAFVRSFGTIWGVAIPAAIFNSRSDSLSHRVVDTTARNLVSQGQAYSHASRDFLNGLDAVTKGEVISVFSDSLRLVWIVAVVFVGFAFFTVFLEREIKLRVENDTEFGIKDQPEKPSEHHISV
ncbi:MFS general substrate transporter [Tothia fuscella]|uniref:MFS general substrate transporter n=1 Tax=Tothia fuscella TaxID=1048955 RepID=A0A9P4NU30_9PEZI|nr:MFS general substrate transporter [Tothia fuscella]